MGIFAPLWKGISVHWVDEKDTGRENVPKIDFRNNFPEVWKILGEQSYLLWTRILSDGDQGKNSEAPPTEPLVTLKLGNEKIEEFLKEVTLKETKKIGVFFHEINSLLSAIPETPETEVHSGEMEEAARPLYVAGFAVAVQAKEIFQDKDNLNQRYHRKRALYLAHIAQYFSKEKLFGSMKFAYMNSNHLKPIVLLRPQGAPEPPTPHYNSFILCDTVLFSHLHFLSSAATVFPGMKYGLALLKVWLNQRQLSKGLGLFSGFSVSMLVAYLLMTCKIIKMMSGYQVLRSTLQFLGELPGASPGRERLVSAVSAQSLNTVGEGGIVAFISLMLRPCGWDGQKGMRQQSRAG
ncbi:hypothetical protein llap_16050 [Limosa lapponica baueri]|uniref:Nucleolar protein 6 n=1 Tax=Limosa lapponica baueri TaxID=1758121 RepID=A0A2I0TIQ3_LIMLA|nr:hypothetical protein llap_16050 [Limosa lapponica baueri]